jgi:uncharacterized SAM-dependent methyltransferase
MMFSQHCRTLHGSRMSNVLESILRRHVDEIADAFAAADFVELGTTR